VTEAWRAVVGFGHAYEVSDLGRVRGVPRVDRLGRQAPARILVNARLSGGYVRIRLRAQCRTVDVPVHHLVLEAFVGPRPPGLHGCHNDGDKRNNGLGNLRWDTPAANNNDKITHGTIARGEQNGSARLSDEQAAAAIRARRLGLSYEVIAVVFGVSPGCIASHDRGISRSWMEVATPCAAEQSAWFALRDAAKERKTALGAVRKSNPNGKRSALMAARHRRAERAVTSYQAALGVAVTWVETRPARHQAPDLFAENAA